MQKEEAVQGLLQMAKELSGAATFKCPDCDTKVLEQTGYCVKCKKKVKKAGEVVGEQEQVAEGLIEIARQVLAEEKTAGLGQVDKAKMAKVVDSFVRFLIGDPRVALATLKQMGSPTGFIMVDQPEDDVAYSELFDKLYRAIGQAIKKTLV